jgi:uncharacterized protein (TIGR02147 family)
MIQNQLQKIPDDFSQVIYHEYEARKQKNKAYSLRALARDLEISSGKLSDIFNGKVGISTDTALKIAKNLSLNEADRNLFLNLVEIYSLKDETSKQASLIKNQSYNFDSKYIVIADDYYSVLTEWYYFALTELVALDCFENNDNWISKRLGIDEDLVRPAIERLKRVNLIDEVEGRLEQTYDFFVSPSGTPSDTAKKFHKQILARAQEAVEKQQIEERDFTSGFLRVRKSDLPYIAQRIKNFRRELVKELESGEGHDSVYAFSVQFFRGDCDSQKS